MTEKLKICVITLGAIPPDLELSKITSYKSTLFETTSSIDRYQIYSKAGGDNWEFTDEDISQSIPDTTGYDFLVAITNVPLKGGWYTRRVKENVVAFSLHGISDYLRLQNVPIVNVVFRLLYAFTLVYRENKKRIPSCDEYTNFTHDDTRGCLFDMNGANKYDIIYSCVSPIICKPCEQRLTSGGVAISDIEKAQEEINSIRKKPFHYVSGWVEHHPGLSIVIASTWAFSIGLLVEYVANTIW